MGPEEAGLTLASILRRRAALSWSGARRLARSGRVELDGEAVLDPSLRVSLGQKVCILERPRRAPRSRPRLILFEDRHLVVAEKPAGISSVPFERGERGTLMEAVRKEWKRRGVPPGGRALYVVHRLDKDASGLIVFARTRSAERALQSQFRNRVAERVYLCLAHGRVGGGRIESSLVKDRGDGLRGSTRASGQGKPAVTHVKVRERFAEATLCEVRLETGRTHQIRIHLAESGHPLVGERIYIRDFVRRGGEPLPAPRLLLHATRLSFDHPDDGRRLSFASRATPDFAKRPTLPPPPPGERPSSPRRRRRS